MSIAHRRDTRSIARCCWVNAVANYAEPVAIGAVMRSFAAGRIVESAAEGWQVGRPVTGMFGS